MRIEHVAERGGVRPGRHRRDRHRDRLGDNRRNHAAANDDDQLGGEDDADQRADRSIFQNACPELGEIDVEHHDDEEEENRDGADVNDQQDHRQELRPRQEEEAGGIKEHQDEEQDRMDRIPRRNNHERRRHRDKGEEIEKKSLQTHVGAFFVFPGQRGSVPAR